MAERKMALVNTMTNVIENMIIFTDENALREMIFPDHMLAVEATNFDVTVGNFYDERGFVIDGEPVAQNPSQEELIAELKSRLEFTQSVIDEILLSADGTV